MSLSLVDQILNLPTIVPKSEWPDYPLYEGESSSRGFIRHYIADARKWVKWMDIHHTNDLTFVYKHGSKTDVLKSTAMNIEVIISSYPLFKDHIFYDDGTKTVVISPILRKMLLTDEADRFTDHLNLRMLKEILQELFLIDDKLSVGDYRAGLEGGAKHNRINMTYSILKPAKFNKLGKLVAKPVVWDKKQRIDNFLTTVFGEASHFDLLPIISRKFMISMVARIIWPGSKADAILALVGKQGVGKGQFTKALAGTSYDGSPLKATLMAIDSKDDKLNLYGHNIIEIEEGVAQGKASTASFKAFITTAFENIRKPYNPNPDRFERNFTFILSTNEKEILRDSTGERRYWPVEIDPSLEKIDLSYVRNNREQLYAEALHILQEAITANGLVMNDNFSVFEKDSDGGLRFIAGHEIEDKLDATPYLWWFSKDEERMLAEHQKGFKKELVGNEQLEEEFNKIRPGYCISIGSIKQLIEGMPALVKNPENIKNVASANKNILYKKMMTISADGTTSSATVFYHKDSDYHYVNKPLRRLVPDTKSHLGGIQSAYDKWSNHPPIVAGDAVDNKPVTIDFGLDD